jgi:hypothetical protein
MFLNDGHDFLEGGKISIEKNGQCVKAKEFPI